MNIFRAIIAKCFRQKPAARNEKNLFIKRINGIRPVHAPEIRFLPIIIGWWGESIKAILSYRQCKQFHLIACYLFRLEEQLFRARSIFRTMMAQPPPPPKQKLSRTPVLPLYLGSFMTHASPGIFSLHHQGNTHSTQNKYECSMDEEPMSHALGELACRVAGKTVWSRMARDTP